jgi:hypothetical protein
LTPRVLAKGIGQEAEPPIALDAPRGGLNQASTLVLDRRGQPRHRRRLSRRVLLTRMRWLAAPFATR